MTYLEILLQFPHTVDQTKEILLNYYKIVGRAFLNDPEISLEDLNNGNLIFEGNSKDEVILYLQPIFKQWAVRLVEQDPQTSVKDQQNLIEAFFYNSLHICTKFGDLL